MASARVNEIWRDAVIAGTVTSVAVAFDLFAHAWHLEALEKQANWWWALAVFIAFLIAFGLVWTGGRFWDWCVSRAEEVQRRQPISLNRIGIIDGEWIGAIRDHPHEDPIQVSIFEIKSSQFGGISASGISYGANDDNVDVGDFRTLKCLLMEKGFVYHFEGRERSGKGVGKEHEGAGFYFFRQVGDKMRFTGAFLALWEESIRHVTGRILTKAEREALRDDVEKKKLIRKFLAEKLF